LKSADKTFLFFDGAFQFLHVNFFNIHTKKTTQMNNTLLKKKSV